jgi:hypothetical protein
VDAVDLVGVVGEEGVEDAVRLRVGRRSEHGDDEGEGREDERQLASHSRHLRHKAPPSFSV